MPIDSFSTSIVSRSQVKELANQDWLKYKYLGLPGIVAYFEY